MSNGLSRFAGRAVFGAKNGTMTAMVPFRGRLLQLYAEGGGAGDVLFQLAAAGASFGAHGHEFDLAADGADGLLLLIAHHNDVFHGEGLGLHPEEGAAGGFLQSLVVQGLGNILVFFHIEHSFLAMLSASAS